MLITPYTNPTDYNKNLEGLDTTRECLLAAADRLESPELLSFLPDVDVEQMTFRGTELCSHILYANLRKLLRLPSIGLIDQKQKYSSIYTSARTMKPFFNGQSLKSITYRLVVEIMLLYGLNGKDLCVMTRWCCNFDWEDGNIRKTNELDYDLLASICSKKQLSNLIRSCLDKQAAYFLPARITKGQEYLSYADFLHTFRAIGLDPYAALYAFAHKDTAKLTSLNAPISVFTTFKTTPLDGIMTKPAATIPIPTTTSDMTEATDNNGSVAQDPIGTRQTENVPREEDTKVSPPALDMTGVGGKNVQKKHKSFGEIIQAAVAPLSKYRPIYLPKNIYILREGVDGHLNNQDRDFDNLFVHSGASNLDVFNYLVRTSYCYGVPLGDLIYEEVQYGKYKPQQSFTAKEYSLTAIADRLQLPPIRDDNLFRLLSIYTLEKINMFGYPVAEKKITHQPAGENQEPVLSQAFSGSTKQEGMIEMNVDLKIRVCYPCDSNSWENDNPDRTAPGFYWGAAEPEICEKAKKSVEQMLSTTCYDPMAIRAGLAQVVNLPFKAQLVVTSGHGFRVSYDLL